MLKTYLYWWTINIPVILLINTATYIKIFIDILSGFKLPRKLIYLVVTARESIEYFYWLKDVSHPRVSQYAKWVKGILLSCKDTSSKTHFFTCDISPFLKNKNKDFWYVKYEYFFRNILQIDIDHHNDWDENDQKSFWAGDLQTRIYFRHDPGHIHVTCRHSSTGEYVGM